MSEPIGWIPLHPRGDRLLAIAEFLEKKSDEEPIRSVCDRLRSAASQDPPDLEADVRLAEDVLAAVHASKLELRRPLNAIREIQWKALQEGKARGKTALYWAQVELDPRQEILLRNMMACHNLAEGGQRSITQAVLAATAVAQAHDLLLGVLQDVLNPATDDKTKIADSTPAQVRDFLKLKWVPDAPVTLDEARNAWSHGSALLHPEGLILFKPGGFEEKMRLTCDDLWTLFAVARITWDAVLLDLVLTPMFSPRPESGSAP